MSKFVLIGKVNVYTKYNLTILSFLSNRNFFPDILQSNFYQQILYKHHLDPMIKTLSYKIHYSHFPIKTFLFYTFSSSLKPDISKDYYSTLQISQSSDIKQIKQSYYNLVKKHHPDQNQSMSDNKIKELNEAYSVLSDQAAKKQYDEKRRQSNPNLKKSASASDFTKKTYGKYQQTNRSYSSTTNTDEQFNAWYSQRVKEEERYYHQQRVKRQQQFRNSNKFENRNRQGNFKEFHKKTWNTPDEKIKLTAEQLQRQRIKIRMKLADAYTSLQKKKQAYKNMQRNQCNSQKSINIANSIEKFLQRIIKPIIDFFILLLNKGRSKSKIEDREKPKKNL